MCGICGVVVRDESAILSRDLLLDMRDSLAHRGPDDAGYYIAPGVALGARRLSILDLSDRGHLPMQTPDGRYSITYNGEVYNYRELRARLEGRGHTFRSNTDTEVVLALYAEEGPLSLSRLNGMFAFAIWDGRERTLFLARDRLGVKPLFYAERWGRFYFASEAKALFAGGIPAEFNPATWEELLCFRYVAGEDTPFVGVKRLLPGHYLLWKDGEVKICRWWHLAERARAHGEEHRRDPFAWFAATFDDAVKLRRISDVPLGVLLSGGLDSGSVAASLASQSDSGVASFTVRFAEQTHDEGPLAKEVADRWGLKYHELTVTAEELPSALRTVTDFNDEPLAHASDLHLWAVAKYAKPFVTVLLSGEGADETLGGYVRYRPLRYPRLLKAGRPLITRFASFSSHPRVGKLARALAMGPLDQMVLFNACDVLPTMLETVGMVPRASFPYRQQVLAEARELYPGDLFRQAMYTDQHTFLVSVLDRNDRMTMGASVECRVPFLDYRLVEGLAALPSSVVLAGYRNKSVLRRSLGRRLPMAVRLGRKWGFGVPWSKYLREVGELREMVQGLADSEPIHSGPFQLSALRNLAERFLAGHTEGDALIRQLLMISIWYDTLRARASSARRARVQA